MTEAPADPTGGGHFIKPTTGFWQEILPPDHFAGAVQPPYRYSYPARLPDGRILELPLRQLPGGTQAVASLIANQASFTVCEEIARVMADHARAAGAEVIVGMPTLGLVFAPRVAELLGHANYVPLGYSRKYWYRDDFSEPVRSITSPGGAKSVFIDPNMLARLAGRRAVVVDDAVSSGTTLCAVLALLGRLDCHLAGIVVAMRQGEDWRKSLGDRDPALPELVRGAFDSPRFERVEGGWQVLGPAR
jgi:adenine/guanine phosphoribosyltransferase-like PRPP-binding protein